MRVPRVADHLRNPSSKHLKHLYSGLHGTSIPTLSGGIKLATRTDSFLDSMEPDGDGDLGTVPSNASGNVSFHWSSIRKATL